eukprot:Seg776.5 transcript_id=Seg776.5/GoldUCD/mRNA.D3Y31 product="hypothetical protein" protein_id=Seg776.5/GoldUCD/D3Y31
MTTEATCQLCSTMLHTTLKDLATKTNASTFHPKKQSDADADPAETPCQADEECLIEPEDEADLDAACVNLSNEEKHLESRIRSLNRKILSRAILSEPADAD